MPVQMPTSQYSLPDLKLPDGRFKYDPNTYNMLGPKAQEGMETRQEWQTREAYEAARESLILEYTPGLREELRQKAQYNSEAQQYKDRLNAGFEPRGGLLGFAEDLASGWWEFAGRKMPASILYTFSSDDQFQEALDDIKTGKLNPGGFWFSGEGGVSYTKEELASRWNDPDGTARELGGVLGSTSMSAAALLGGGPAGIAVIGTFGLMGTGDGMAEFDRIAAENNLDPDQTERLLMGVGYGAAEAGAEYLGLGAAKLSSALIGRKMARELGEEVVEKGIWAGVKKYGKFAGVTVPAGAATEGGEEVATQIAQNSIRAWADPNVDWTIGETFDGTVDAFVMGAFGGGIMVGPAIAVESYKKSQAIKGFMAEQGEIAIQERDEEARLRDVVQQLEENPVEPEFTTSETGEQLVSVFGVDNKQINVEATEENIALAKAQLEAMAIDGTDTPPQDVTPEQVKDVIDRIKGFKPEPKEAVEEPSVEGAVEEVEEVEGAVGLFDGNADLVESWTYGPQGQYETQEQAEEIAESQADLQNQPYAAQGQDGPFGTANLSVDELSDFKPDVQATQETAEETEVVADQPVEAIAADPSELQQRQQVALDQIDAQIRRSRNLPERQEGEAPLAKALSRKEEKDLQAQPQVLKRLRVFAKRQGRDTGKPLEIVQVETQDQAGFDGLYHDGVIYVDATKVRDPKKESEYSKEIFTRILAHELTHAGRVANPELYEQLIQSMPKASLGASEMLYAARLGKEAFSQLSSDARVEEALATHIEDVIFKIGSGRYTGDQTLVGKLVDFVRSTAAKYGLKGKFAKNLDSIVRQMADGKSLEDITLPGMQEAGAVAAPAVESDPKFSPADNQVTSLPVKSVQNKVEAESGVVFDGLVSSALFDQDIGLRFSPSPVLPKARIPRNVSLTDYAGQEAFVYFSDRMKVGNYPGLDPKSGINIPLQGGPGYPFIIGNKNKAVWAFTAHKAMVTSWLNRANQVGGLGAVALMARGNVRGNPTFLKAYFEELNWAIESGKLEGGTTRALEVLNDLRSKAIASKEFQVKVRGDELWKVSWETLSQAEAAMEATTFDVRSSKIFEWKPEKKSYNKGSKIGADALLKEGFPNLTKMVDAMEEPKFKNLNYGDIVALIKAKPGQSEPSSASNLGVQDHLSYPFVVEGNGIGWLDTPINVLKYLKTEKPAKDALTYARTSMAPIRFSPAPTFETKEYWDAAAKTHPLARSFTGHMLTVYHGSPSASPFYRFDPDRVGTLTDVGFLGRGFYFTPHRARAETYAQQIPDSTNLLEGIDVQGAREAGGMSGQLMAVNLILENPLVITQEHINHYEDFEQTAFLGLAGEVLNPEDPSVFLRRYRDVNEESVEERELITEVTDRLMQAGYDGVILDPANSDFREFVAFDPAQIKSTTDNVGTYGQRQPTEEEAAQLGMSVEEAVLQQELGDIRLSPTGTPGKSIEDIAGNDSVAWGAVFMVRDNITDFNEWRSKIKAKFPEMTDKQIMDLWKDSIIMSNYITDISDTGASKRVLDRMGRRPELTGASQVPELQTPVDEIAALDPEEAAGLRETEPRIARVSRESIADYASLKRQIRLQSKAATEGYRTGVKVGAARAIAKSEARINSIQQRAKAKKELKQSLVKEFEKALKQGGMASKSLNSIFNKRVRTRDFNTIGGFLSALQEANKSFEEYRKQQAQAGLKKSIASLNKAKLRPEFDSKAKELLDEYGIGEKEISSNKRNELVRLRNWMTRMTVAGEEISLPQDLIDRINDVSEQSIKDLSEQDALTLRDGIRTILHLNRLKNKLIKKGRQQEYAAARDAVGSELSKRMKMRETYRPDPSVSEVDTRQKIQKVSKNVWSKTMLLMPDRFAIWISGGRDTQTYKWLYEDLAEGQSGMLGQYQSDKDFLVSHLIELGINPDTKDGASRLRRMSAPMAHKHGLIQSIAKKIRYRSGRLSDVVDVHKIKLESGRVIEITSGERISLLCHFSDPDTRKYILKGSPLRIDEKLQFRLTENDINTIENLFGDVLEEDIEKQIANVILERINGSMRIAMQEYSVNYRGYDITKDHTYYPRRRYRDKVDTDPVVAASGVFAKTLDSLGITMDRGKDAVSPIILGDAFSVYNNHSYMVAGLRHMAEPLRNADRILNSPEIKRMLQLDKRGKDIRNYYDSLLNDLATEISGVYGKNPSLPVNQWTRSLAKGITVGALGFNPRVMFYQVASLAAASSEISPELLARAANQTFTYETTKEMELHSPYLRERFASDAYGLVSEGLTTRPQSNIITNRTLADMWMKGIGKFDEFAIRTIWGASKLSVEQDIKSGVSKFEVGSEEYWDAVTERAETVVKKSQPTMDLLHMSGMARQSRKPGGEIARLLSMFASQRHKNVNMQAEAIIRFNNGDKVGATKGLIAHTIAQPMVLWAMRGLYSATMGWAIAGLWDLLMGEAPEKEEDELHWFASLFDNILAANFGNLPLGDYPGQVVREGIGALLDYDPDTYDPELSPVLSLVGRTQGSIKRFAQTAYRSLDPNEDVAFADVLSAGYYAGVDLITITGQPTHFLRELARPARERTTHVKILISRRNKLMKKDKTDDGLTSEERLELFKINRAYLGKYGISADRRRANNAKKSREAAEKSGNKQLSEGWRKTEEKYTTRADEKARQVVGGGE